MRDSADADHAESSLTPEIGVAVPCAAMRHDQPAPSLVAAYRDSDLALSKAHRKVVFRYMDGIETSLSLDPCFKPQYTDEYSHEVLLHETAKDAILGELQCVFVSKTVVIVCLCCLIFVLFENMFHLSLCFDYCCLYYFQFCSLV